MADSPVIERVRELIGPIVSDLQLDLYDLQMKGGTLQVMLDTPSGSDAGVSLDTLTLATRLISTELDHSDPVPGSYQLEVTSPGLERQLRTPAHFAREVGKVITVRIANTSGPRRFEGTLTSATEDAATIAVSKVDGADIDDVYEQQISLADVDKARTVFEWGPQPKKGGAKKGKQKNSQRKAKQSGTNQKENR